MNRVALFLMFTGALSLFPQGAAPPLRVPSNTLLNGAQGTQVVTVTPDRKAHYVMVELGQDFGQEVEVLDGLRGDEQLVTNPSDSLKEGAPVEIAAGPRPR